MMKMIFSDFDNTLLDYYSEDNYFDDYKISILKRIQDKGIKFCIVTGRAVSFFKQFPNLLEVVDYIMGSNGACIYDVKNNKYLYNIDIDGEDFDKVIKYLVDNNYSFILNCKDKRYRYGNFDGYDCLDFNINDKYSCEQIIFRVLKEDFDRVFTRLENIANIRMNNMSCWENYWSIDINNRSVSKGNSVLWLCDYLGIDADDAIAFGDGDNDKSMFKVINKGVAVGNAVDNLKVLSREIALDCDENGVYKYIEDNFLK